jgi:hypothetical protein
MTFELQDPHVTVTCCWDCPRNQSYQNPLMSILPPTHYCADTFDLHTKGHIILYPHQIPKWCPHVKPD